MDARSATPLFAAAGREWELEALVGAWERVEAKSNAFVRIHGPAGIGKTHLLRVAAGRLAERGATVVEAGALRDCAPESFALAA